MSSRIGRGLQPPSHSRRRQSVLHRACLETLESRLLLSTSVLQWSGGLTGNSLYSSETLLTPSDVSSGFTKLSGISLPGGTADMVYAQPLYVENLTLTGLGTVNGTHNVVIVATEANNVYAYDTITFQKLWSINLGTPVPASSPGGPAEQNFYPAPAVGITGTPVIDPVTDIMYLDATHIIGSGTTSAYDHVVYAINISNGTVANSITLGSVPAVSNRKYPELPPTRSTVWTFSRPSKNCSGRG